MAQGNIIGVVISIAILAIIVFNVVIPIVKDSISNSNLTSIESTIANLISLFMIIGLFMMVVYTMVVNYV